MSDLTKRAVESAPPGAILWDNAVRGFGVRVRDSGNRFYFTKYRNAQGRQRWETIGRHGSPWTVDSARRKAKVILGLVADDEDPAEKRDWEGGLPTITEFSETYLERHARRKKRPRTVTEDERNLKLHILPALGAIRIDAITAADVARFHAARGDAPINANRCLALVSHMLRMAEKWRLRPAHSNPCRDVERYEEVSRERYLSAAELARLGLALADAETKGALSPFVLGALRVLIFTGARKGEIVTLTWAHVDMARGVARRDTKTGIRNIYLPPPALAVLEALQQVDASPWVFPGERDTKKPIGNLDGAWRTIRAAAKLDDVHLHDLRHAFASVAAASGGSLHVIGAVLGHKHATTTQRYAHLSADPIAAAATATAERIAAAMRPRAVAAPTTSMPARRPRR